MCEIRGLQWGDIRDGQLTVRRALDKETGEAVAPKHNKARTIPLWPRLAAELAALPPLGLWVVGRLNGDALGYYSLLEAIGTLYVRANVERPPKPVHCLRHTFGTVMAAEACEPERRS
jgi:integrase